MTRRTDDAPRGGPLDDHHRPPRRGRGGTRGRARRGAVRSALLALLAEEPQHGYELIQNLERRTEGAWRPSPGSVYPNLRRLENEGLVTSSDVEGRRVFTITDEGRARVEAADGPVPWAELARGRSLVDTRSLIVPAREIAATGDPAQIEAARKVVSAARRSLYLILAGEEPKSD